MSSNAFDVQIPATEIQIAEAIHASDPNTADTIRRLAFERDKLKADLGKTTRELGFANVRGDLALAESDPPVCRLQFPDGTVPGNAREAAEGWKRWAVEFKRRADLWERLHDKVRVGNFAIRTTYSMPEPHQLVIVAGGIAVWTGSVWLSKTGDDTNRVIDWPVEWWMPLPCGRIPDANGPATLSQAVTKPLVEDLLEATQ